MRSDPRAIGSQSLAIADVDAHEVVEREVELDDVDTRLAEHHRAADRRCTSSTRSSTTSTVEPAFVGDPSDLQAGVGDRDVRVEARSPTR